MTSTLRLILISYTKGMQPRVHDIENYRDMKELIKVLTGNSRPEDIQISK